MTSMAVSIADLIAECDDRGILLLPASEGGLTIDAPSPGALTHELVERIKAGKAAILDILATPELPRLVFGPDGWPVDTIDPTDRKAVCRCGSTGYRDIPIHKGQSLRRDCAKCGRFIRFEVWYGTGSFLPISSLGALEMRSLDT